ncbi:hypothetical protein PISMIDRAFT_104849 [Pisolithus microcarpus 441]|uniref:DUF6532 domain-containing protein n=1 Tax=Pisolithus microcarpus 441 TaxID=765257 RepID=A0A0C9ZMI4_9AGAM|nr:hypothetical protein BKA83DRAFT_104849 [Pisolithus microcarpus]KIK20993.1 hypothetical protein PISMIDRAFT_104849 [Pisolithus microcarpus 441]
MDYDVNARHQSQNCCTCPPSPTYLEDTVSGEKHPSKKLCSNVVSQVQGRLHSEEDCSGNSTSLVSECCGKYSRTTKADVVVWPTMLAFFSPLWCKLLGEAKARMQLYVATEVPFLCHEMVINGVCMEILVEMVIKYEDDGLELEADLDSLVCTSPLALCNYCQIVLQGRTSNFAHSALKKTCLAIYYCTSSKSLCQFAKFQESVPVKVLALVTAIIRYVLMTFKKHGVAKNETLCGDEIEDACNNITHLIDQVWYDDYHGSKLDKML